MLDLTALNVSKMRCRQRYYTITTPVYKSLDMTKRPAACTGSRALLY